MTNEKIKIEKLRAIFEHFMNEFYGSHKKGVAHRSGPDGISAILDITQYCKIVDYPFFEETNQKIAMEYNNLFISCSREEINKFIGIANLIYKESRLEKYELERKNSFSFIDTESYKNTQNFWK